VSGTPFDGDFKIMDGKERKRGFLRLCVSCYSAVAYANTIFILFYEKMITNTNTTKKVYINNHTKTKKKQLKVS